MSNPFQAARRTVGPADRWTDVYGATLRVEATTGQNQLTLTSAAMFLVGDTLTLGPPNGTQEAVTIASISGDRITLTANVTADYPVGTAIVLGLPAEHPDLGEHDDMGLATQAELEAHAASPHAGSIALADTVRLPGDAVYSVGGSNQNALDPASNTVLRIRSTSTISLRGITGGTDGRVLIAVNDGANNWNVQHEHTSASAADRINTGGSTVTLAPNDAVVLKYDGGTSRWVMQDTEAAAKLTDPRGGLIYFRAPSGDHPNLAAHDALGLATQAELDALDSDLTTHAGAADPHTGYQKESEKGAANGYASLDGSTLVPVAELATGTPNGSKFLRDDRTWAIPAGGGGGGAIESVDRLFPVVAATNTSVNTGNTTPATVALPSGIEAGDLLLIFWTDRDTNTTLTVPSGWAVLHEDTEGNHRAVCLWRIADGGEGSSVSIATSAGERSAHNSYRIARGTYLLPLSGSHSTSGSGTTPNLGPMQAWWGAKRALWLVAAHSAGQGGGSVTLPTSYTNKLQSATSGGTGASHATTTSGRRELATHEEDPGSFTLPTSGNYVVQGVGIFGAPDFPAAPDDDQIVFVSDERAYYVWTGGEWRLVAASDTVDVRAYGAKVDGVTDDAAAIQAAIDDNDGKRILLPGLCAIASTIYIQDDGTRLVGLHGFGGLDDFTKWALTSPSGLRWIGTNEGGPMLVVEPRSTLARRIFGVGVERILLDGGGTNKPNVGLRVRSVRNSTFNVTVRGCLTECIYLGCRDDIFGEPADLQDSDFWLVAASSSAAGVVLDGDAGGGNTSINRFHEIKVHHQDQPGIVLKNEDHNTFSSIRVFALSGTQPGVLAKAGSSGSLRSRRSLFLYFEASNGLKLEGTDVAANPPIEHRILYYSKGNGTPDPDLGPGASLDWRSEKLTAGTAFPTGVPTGYRFFRTDRGIEYFYDGTRWLSMTLYVAEHPTGAVFSGNANNDIAVVFPEVYDHWIEDFVFAGTIQSGGTALGASHNWVTVLSKWGSGGTNTTVSTITINSGSNGERIVVNNVNALMGSTFGRFRFNITRTGTPGSLVAGFYVTYRLVG